MSGDDKLTERPDVAMKPAPMTPLLQLRGVTKTYDGQAGAMTILDHIDLSIHAGEMVAIVGQSGSGKSTLMHVLGCLDRATSGSYEVAGQAITNLEPDALALLRREHFGFIFQRYHLLPDLNARENIEMPAVYLGMDVGNRRSRAQDLLSRFGLAERGDHRPSALSGGQQQRVSIARALMNGGNVILADEPTGALDSISGAEVLATLRALHAQGHTVVIVTHDMSVAARADRIIEIHDGKIVSDRLNGTGATEHAEAASRASPFSDDRQGRRQGRQGWRDSIKTAWFSLTRHRLRTFLTMLSVTIGIASVVTMAAVGAGVSAKILDEIRAFGADAVYILPGKDSKDRRAAAIQTLIQADVDAIAQRPYVDSVSPKSEHTITARRGGQQTMASVSGVNEQFFRIRNAKFALGGGMSKAHFTDAMPVAILDHTARQALIPDDVAPLGQTILIGQMHAKVIGVLEADEQGGDSMQRAHVFVPATALAVRLTGQHYFQYLMVKLKEGKSFEQIELDLEQLMAARHGSKDFHLMSFEKYIRAYIRNADMLNLLMIVVAVISLTVAGIGVMNIMLVSVTERTNEIGIRMAVGARQPDIRRQFMSEAVLVCALGGALGIALSVSLVQLVPLIAPSIHLHLSMTVIVFACLISTFVGIGFGYFPAKNAASLDPIRALTHHG